MLVAPGNRHLRIGPGGVVALDDGPKVNSVRPSLDVALESVVGVYGASVVAAILTGIGSDGARGAAAVRQAGGAVLTEDRSTCVVWGMPRAVEELGLANLVLPLGRIGEGLAELLRGPCRVSSTGSREGGMTEADGWMDAEFLAEVRELFNEGAPSTVESLRQAAATGDMQQVGRLAHTLAGESGAVGYASVELCCRQLIELAHVGAIADVTALVDQLDRLVELAIRAS